MARTASGVCAAMAMAMVASGCSDTVRLGGTGASTGSAATTSGGSASGGSTGTATGGATIAGATTAGASSTSGTTSTGGTSGGLLAAGAKCSADGQCSSGVCGLSGSGNCCLAACSKEDATCGATACDNSGACTYPSTTAACGASSCSGNQLTSSACDGNGTCSQQAPAACPGNLPCQDATSCKTTCGSSSDCISGFYCNAGSCLAPHATGACSSNDACTSGLCGVSGTGDCCSAACAPAADPACNATDCDPASGACSYAVGNPCASSCTDNTLTAGACDATGACGAPSTGACPGNLICNGGGTGCLAACTQASDCIGGFYCNNGRCDSLVGLGQVCGTNGACTSGICGSTGSGHCCSAGCSVADPSCGATDCDGTGACVYPDTTASCGTESCTGNTQTDTSTCDGAGICLPQGTTDCTPYVCGKAACLAHCALPADCTSGNICDDDSVGNAVCCAAVGDGDTLAVDSTTGNDAAACCGYAGAGACKTLTHAMSLIEAAKATGVTLNATVNGAGGDWGGEPAYPVVLALGVELSAPGVNFLDGKQLANAAIFDIITAGADGGAASIVGSATSPVSVGFDSTGFQTDAVATIQVENGNTLYIANASVNGRVTAVQGQDDSTAAIVLQGAAGLVLGEDQAGLVTGTVTIGNAIGNAANDGFQGILCTSDLADQSGCTVSDVDLGGASSVVIQGQEGTDLAAGPYANITLSANPVFGVAPSDAGTGECPFVPKTDGQAFNSGAGLFVVGPATVSISNATFQCIENWAVVAQSVFPFPKPLGPPSVTLANSTIQNSGVGIYAIGGTITVTDTTLKYNGVGVWQDVDPINAGKNGGVDLSGGGNTVVCSSDAEDETTNGAPTVAVGIDVYNASTANLAADNVAWDTTAPDYFSCNAPFQNCACNLASCTVTAGVDGMDAVEDSTNLGGITTTNNTLSSIACQ